MIVVYLFHGEEPFQKSERIAALRAGISADPSFIDLNVTELDGRSLTIADLRHHCESPPFLGEYRLVIVHDLLSKGAGKRADEFVTWLAGYLGAIPDSTRLVLSENEQVTAKHAVLKAVQALGAQGEVQAFAAPQARGGDLAAWITHRAGGKGATLAAGVAADLANFIGADLRLIDVELEKLRTYAGDRPITQADVRLLTPYAQEANIFDMVDALGHRRTQQAFALLARLRNEGAHPLYLLTMIVRQYRILLQVKDLMGRGMDKDAIAKAIGLHTFPTGKAIEQARHYSMGQLQAIYDRLLETDVAIKRGRMEANLALDVLVVELARA